MPTRRTTYGAPDCTTYSPRAPAYSGSHIHPHIYCYSARTLH